MKYVSILLLLLLPTFFIGNSSPINYDNVDYLYIVDLPEITILPEPDQADVILLAKLIAGESPYELFFGQVAVVNTVQNRSKRKNKNFNFIVYQKGQYDGVNTSRFRKDPSQAHREAARAALIGLTVIPYGVQFFANERAATDTKWIRSKKKDKWGDIGNHTFYWIRKLKP